MADPQILQPITDITNSGWTVTPSGNVYQAIDGVTPSDDSYVTAVDTAIFQVRLEQGATPESGEHVLIVRPRQSGADNAKIRVTLYQGSMVVLGPRDFSAGSSTFGDISISLTQDEIDRLGDRSNLQLKVETFASPISVCCPMVLQCEVDSSSGCGAFFSGTYGFYAPNPPDEQPVYGGVGPGWELDPQAHSYYAIMTINCTEDGRYVMFAQARRNIPDGSPPIYDEHQEFFYLEECDDPVNWTMTFHLNAANFACPSGTVTFTVTKA